MSKPYGIFGAGRILHGGDYNPDQWLKTPEYIDDDFRLMRQSGCNTFSLGIFAWTSYEPIEGQYTFDWLDRIMDRMAEAGNNVILATPSGAKPAWMARKYPEIRRVTKEGAREPIEVRHNHCWRSPVYREKVRDINTALAERYKGHPALKMWHISNEYSGWCYCDYCLAAWREWLRQRYGTLDKLNEAWWAPFWSHTFTDWDQIDPQDFSMDGLAIDWYRFNTQQVVDFFEWEVQPLRAITPEIPCTTNFMGLFGQVDYSTLADHMDIIADDQYPRLYPDDPEVARTGLWISFKDNIHRCFKPDRPWMLMESCPDAVQWGKPKRLKRPGVHRMEMLQAIGNGAEGTCYFQWRAGRGSMEKFHGAVVDHSNSSETRVFKTVEALSGMYEKLTPVLGTDVEAEVAQIYDWECRWGFEFSDGTPSEKDAYIRTGMDHYQPFWESGISVDVFRSERDFSGYKLVIAPILWMLKPGVAERIRSYVENGGTFVATYFSGMGDESNRVFMGGLPGEGLKDLFGIWNEETDVLDEGKTIPILGVEENSFGIQQLTGKSVRAISHLQGATAVATYGAEFYAGTPAITVNRVGKGQAIYIGVELTIEGLRSIYGSLVESLGIRRALDAEYPKTVAVQRRGRFVFLENFSNKAAAVRVRGDYRNVETGAPVGDLLELDPAGSEVIEEG